MQAVRRVYDWMGSKVENRYALWWLSGLFFIESSCFPIPVDPLLILFCIKNHTRSFYYAWIATCSSVVGGLFGYLIGWLLWDSIGSSLVQLVISPSKFQQARDYYAHYQILAVVIAGFTPLPYKAVTISAGFCKLPLAPFLFFSFLARGARFFLVAGVIRIWGPQMQDFIDRFFSWLVLLFVGLIILSVWVIK